MANQFETEQGQVFIYTGNSHNEEPVCACGGNCNCKSGNSDACGCGSDCGCK